MGLLSNETKAKIKAVAEDYAISHYHTMPKGIQRKMLYEGKKIMEKEHPIISTFLPESMKEKLVEEHFTQKEIERYKRGTSFWDSFF